MTFTERDFEKLMKANGYIQLPRRGKGSHKVYGNGNRTISIGNSYNRMVIQRLIKEYNLIIP